MTSCFLFCTPRPFQKGVYSRRKEFAPMGSKFFPSRIDPFSEGRQNNFDKVASPESISLTLKYIEKVSPRQVLRHHNSSHIMYVIIQESLVSLGRIPTF